jgi:hypothetical protein
MQRQLDEMQYSRNVQVQPLIYPKNVSIEVYLPNYYVLPEFKFKKMELLTRIFVTLEVANIGSGPAVEVEFIPKLVGLKTDSSFGWKFPDAAGDNLVDSLGGRIECISLQEGRSQEILFSFFDSKNRLAQAMVDKKFAYLVLQIVFKNAVGGTFKELAAFDIYGNSEKEIENLKQCLKLAKTAEIDFADRVKEFESLIEKDEAKATDVSKRLHNDMAARFHGCGEFGKFTLPAEIASGSFSIAPIPQEEYAKMLSEKPKLKRVT